MTMLCRLFGALLLALCATPVFAAPQGFAPDSVCDEKLPATLIRTTVGIEIPLSETERPKPYIVANQGTAWFRSKTRIVLIEHVATSSFFTTNWRDVTLFWSDAKDEKFSHTLNTQARLANVFTGDPGAEVLVELELRDEVPGAEVAKIRASPLQQFEPVVALAYRHYESLIALAYVKDDPRPALRFATGRVTYPTESAEPSDDAEPPVPYIPLEMADGNYRNALGRGASGAPVFDCDGQLVADVVYLKTRAMGMGTLSPVEVTPSWGNANNFAVGTLHLARIKNSDTPNLVLPMHDVMATDDASSPTETPDEKFTRLTNALADATRRQVESGGDLSEVQKAWEALNAFTTKRENSSGAIEMPPSTLSPFD